MPGNVMDELKAWLLTNNGSLHPSTELGSDEKRGNYMVAKEDIPDGERIMTVPHSLFLSCLNAMVDDSLPVLKANADSFTVEALGVLYLMSQWLNKEKSFWKPFLEILPTPDQGFNTPFWFDEDDLRWLEGTDLSKTFKDLEAGWQKYWRDDTKILAEGGMDVSGYTWTLCKWAATVFNSRSLSSRAVTPQDSKYWTAYKQGPRGRQTVLLDFSRVPQARKDFPVLVPVMDCLNHHPKAKIDWSFDPGRFGLSLHEGVSKGSEIFNNYGPKSNSELLMGYGFCIEGNPYDTVYETLKAPPRELNKLLRAIHPGYFTTMGLWNSKAATFRLSGWNVDSGDSVWDCIPPPLVELFYYIVMFERGLPVTPIEDDPKQYLLQGHGRRVLPRIAFYIVSSLMPKINKISEAGTSLPEQPVNERQRYAKIYRDGQLSMMYSLRVGLLTFNRSFRPAQELTIPASIRDLDRRPYVFTLEEAMCAMLAATPAQHEQFITGILAAFSIEAVAQLRGSDLEQHVWVLYLCAAFISCRSIVFGSLEELARSETGLLPLQVRSLSDEYEGHQYTSPVPAGSDDDQGDPEGRVFMDLVAKAAAAVVAGDARATNIWRSPLWSNSFVLDWGLRIARSQGMHMRLADDDVRYVLYLHLDDQLLERQEAGSG
ncbi:SET domain-containing protein 1 [Elsinoe fawcettii]|nr:SET domain-containing protein 1 [Elsinoe fawcettii]